MPVEEAIDSLPDSRDARDLVERPALEEVDSAGRLDVRMSGDSAEVREAGEERGTERGRMRGERSIDGIGQVERRSPPVGLREARQDPAVFAAQVRPEGSRQLVQRHAVGSLDAGSRRDRPTRADMKQRPSVARCAAWPILQVTVCY
jgi:hypothetical protein